MSGLELYKVSARIMILVCFMPLVISCTTVRISAPAPGNETTSVINKVATYVFSLDGRGRQAEGVLYAGKTGPQQERFVLTSPMGPTLLDLETDGKHYKVHSAIPALNKKKVLNLLWKDFLHITKDNAFPDSIAVVTSCPVLL
jgi:hypothetical protein